MQVAMPTIGRRELLSWAERHTKKRMRDYGALADGAVLSGLFNLVFPQCRIKIASPETHSPSQRAAQNWLGLHRGMDVLRIPHSTMPRAAIEAADEPACFSALALFFFLHNVARHPNFTAEFAVDITEDLATFLQSFESIRALVVGGGMSIEMVPAHLRASVVEAMQSISSAASSTRSRSSSSSSQSSRASSAERPEITGSRGQRLADESLDNRRVAAEQECERLTAELAACKAQHAAAIAERDARIHDLHSRGIELLEQVSRLRGDLSSAQKQSQSQSQAREAISNSAGRISNSPVRFSRAVSVPDERGGSREVDAVRAAEHVRRGLDMMDRQSVAQAKKELEALAAVAQTLGARLAVADDALEQLTTDRRELLELVNTQQSQLDEAEAVTRALRARSEALEELAMPVPPPTDTSSRQRAEHHHAELAKVYDAFADYERRVEQLERREADWHALCSALHALPSCRDPAEHQRLDAAASEAVARLANGPGASGTSQALKELEAARGQVLQQRAASAELEEALHDVSGERDNLRKALQRASSLRQAAEASLQENTEENAKTCAALRVKIQTLLSENCDLELKCRQQSVALTEAHSGSVSTARSVDVNLAAHYSAPRYRLSSPSPDTAATMSPQPVAASEYAAPSLSPAQEKQRRFLLHGFGSPSPQARVPVGVK